MGRIRSIAMAGLMLAGLSLATPLAAQRMSDGFEFLKAVKDRDGNKVTELLEKPGTVIVNARDVSTGEGGLHYAVQRRDLTWVRFLLGKGANANLSDKAGVTPLQLAANLGWAEGAEVLVDAGAQVELANSSGETPLIAAIHRRDVALVRVLLKGGANPERSDNSGRTAMDYARLLGNSSPILAELDKAREERKARAAKSYGPGA